MNIPLVFINILVWNGEKWLKKCLDSVLASRYPNYQVLVIDNGSSDNSVAIIEKDYPQLKLIKNKKNLGFAEGHNAGIRYALKQDADYILLLNQDIQVELPWLRELMKAVSDYPEFSIFTPFQYNYSGKEIDPHFLSRMLLYAKGFKEDYERGVLKPIYEHDCSLGAAMLVKREVFLKVGLFDPLYFIYHEESDFLQRCFYYGFRMAAVSVSRVNHWHTSIHPEKMSLKSRYFSYRNHFIVTLKNPRLPLIKNLLLSLNITRGYLRNNWRSFSGIIKICFVVGLQLLVLFLLPLLVYKRFSEKRRPCYI